TTDPAGLVTTFTFDEVGNQLSVVAPDGSATSSAFDRANNVLDVTAHDGTTTHTTYNTADLPTIVEAGRSTPTATDGAKSITLYDADGRVTETHADCQSGSVPCSGGVDQGAKTWYDALGDPVASATYATAGVTGTARTTTGFFETITATWNGSLRTFTRLAA